MYLRAIAVTLMITGMVAGAMLGPRWLMSDSDDESSDHRTCDLRAGSCAWQRDGDPWAAFLVASGSDGEVKLDLRGPPIGQRMTAILRGESMYLGEYPVPMERNHADGGWSATFRVPFCTVDPEMVWRVDFHHGKELARAEGFIPRPVFSAQAGE